MVYFEDNFWGEKNSGYDVLHHTMKYGLNASKELADFVRDRATVEENYAKSLSKICKTTSTGAPLGTFEPCWTIIKSSTEILANSHSQVVQELQELIKSIRDYGEAQKETQKNLKEELNATAEAVNLIQTKTAAVLKAKDTYYSRCQEFEKVKKETTNAKDIEKAEQKKIRAGEEYKSLIDKREEVRKTFHAKMIETAKKFEELELSHLKKMSEHLLSYIVSLESGQESVEKVLAHFRKQVTEQTTDKLLDHFVKERGTGRNVPDEIVFEEFTTTGSLVEIEAEESPNVNPRAQSITGTYDGVKEMVGKMKSNATILRYPEREYACSWSLFTLKRRLQAMYLRRHDEVGPDEVVKAARNYKYVTKQYRKPPLVYIISLTSNYKQTLSKAFRKKKKKEKDKEPKEKKTKKKKEKDKGQTPNGTVATSTETNSTETLPGNDAQPEVDEEGYRIIPKDAESTKSHDSGSDFDSDDDEEPKKIQITIKPAAEKTTASLDEFRSIQLILPNPAVWQKKGESSSLDGDIPRTNFNSESNIQSSHKFSKSQEDLLSIDFSQPVKVPSAAATSSFNSNQNQLGEILSPSGSAIASTNAQAGDVDRLSSVDDISDKPPELAPKKRISLKSQSNSNNSSPALPPKKSISSLPPALSGSSGSLSDSGSTTSTVKGDKEPADETRNPVQGSVSLLAPPRPDIPRTTSAGSLQGTTASRPRPKPRLSAGGGDLTSGSLSLKPSSVPTRTYASSTTAANTAATETNSSFSADLLANVSTTTASMAQLGSSDTSELPPKTIWDRINNPANQRSVRGNAAAAAVTAAGGTILQPTVANSSNTQAVKKHEDIIPVAVALVETVNAYFKGKDVSKNNVTGDITVSFPASAINSLSTVDNPPVLSFGINGSSLLENVLPNKSLLSSDDLPNETDSKHFKFKMSALLAHLKKQAEQGQAPYYNIDILKYQVQHGIPLIPLSLSCYWKCEERTTDVKIDYQYSPSCFSSPTPLNNVSVVVPVNGGVEIMQSKPIAKWSKEHRKALWQIQEVSSNSEGHGSSSLRARFDLAEGPSVAQPVAVQFQCNGSTLSKIDFQLNTNMYKLSLVKRKIITGKYIADPAN